MKTKSSIKTKIKVITFNLNGRSISEEDFVCPSCGRDCFKEYLYQFKEKFMCALCARKQ